MPEPKDNYHSLEKHLVTKIPVAKQNDTVKSVLSLLEKKGNIYDSVDYIYVTDSEDHLIGLFNIQELFNNPKETPIQNFMHKNVITISPGQELEKISDIALKHNLKQIPVVKSKKLIGVVPSRKILSTLNKSLREDIFHFAGIHKSHMEFESSMDAPLAKSIKNRLSWLIVGLIGSMIMVLYIGLFEETLAKYIIIASFIPAIVYMSGALGTQFQTVLVRDIAILGKDLNFRKYFLRQATIAFFVSTVVGIILFFFIAFIWNASNVAFAIALATFISLMVTSFNSLIITLLIKRFKFDPALGSGPIATIISDITSIIIYFLIIVWLI